MMKVGAMGSLIGPILKLCNPDGPAGLFGSANGWSLGTPIFIILEMDPSLLSTVDETALIPFEVVKSGSPGLTPKGLSERRPNRPGLDSVVLESLLFSVLELLILLPTKLLYTLL